MAGNAGLAVIRQNSHLQTAHKREEKRGNGNPPPFILGDNMGDYIFLNVGFFLYKTNIHC